jgi:ribulose 1,5-bisphosphate synthetase/thiazole synthase
MDTSTDERKKQMTHPIAIGTVLEVTQHGGGTNKFVVDGYNEADYMKMTNLTKRTEGMTIHPEHASRIASNGVDSGIKVLNAETLADIIVKATEAVVDVPTLTTTVVGNGTSKKDRALAIKAANPNATRKELIAMFVEQLNMTPAGASTYASYK